jgi:hypothetical protein
MNGTASRPADPIDRIALVAATLPLMLFGIGGNYEQPDPLHFGALVAGGTGLAAILANRRWAGIAILIAVLALGVFLRANTGYNRASDVMVATSEAVAVLESGNDPYTHTYAMTNPPGGLFGYPPGEIAFYALAQRLGANLFDVDRIAGIVSLGLIAALAPLIGDGLAALAIGALAVSGDLVFHATDGSNDTAAAFLVLAGLVALAWSPAARGRVAQTLWWTSAVAFGWALAFKEYTFPIVLFVGLFLWQSDARRARDWGIAVAATAALFVLPFLAWNPAGFVANVGGALLVHRNVWGRNLWHDFGGLAPGAIDFISRFIPSIMILVVYGVGYLLWRYPARALGMALLQGCAVIATIFVLARWTTSVYYVFLAPLVVTGIVLALGAERRAVE